MKLQLSFPSLDADFKIRHSDRLFFIGSCFAETMSTYFVHRKFSCLQNPYGILYNPHSIANCLQAIATKQGAIESDFYEQDGLVASWHHHSNLAAPSADDLKRQLHQLNIESHQFIQAADVVFITLGTAWVYRHKEKNIIVANNLKAPGHLFEKELLSTKTILQSLERMVSSLRSMHSTIRIVFTVSPVRHVRQGLVANNRSKARLLEAVHTLCDKDATLLYLPTYEMVIDVLRDYRFYASDLVHPNDTATQIIWEYLHQHLLHPEDYPLLDELYAIYLATLHKLRYRQSDAAKKFRKEQYAKLLQLQDRYAYLDFTDELKRFSEL